MWENLIVDYTIQATHKYAHVITLSDNMAMIDESMLSYQDRCLNDSHIQVNVVTNALEWIAIDIKRQP
jgi:hypothetical protein